MEMETNLSTDIKTEINIKQETVIDDLELKQEHVEVDINSAAASLIEDNKYDISKVKVKIEEEVIENDGLVEVKCEEVDVKCEEVNIKHEEDFDVELNINPEKSDDNTCSESDVKANETILKLKNKGQRSKKPLTGFNCRCTFQSTEKSKLRTHVRRRHTVTKDLKNIICEHCDYTTTDKSNFNRHLLVHGNKKSFVCIACNRSFNRKDRIDAHIISKHPEDKMMIASVTTRIQQCQHCSYRCVSSKDLTRHFSRHKTLKTNYMNKYKYKHCDYTSNDDINIDQYKCEICGYTTNEKRYLNRHLLVHSTIKSPLKCAICTKSFREKRTLDSHILHVHSKDKNLTATVTSKIHECEICSYKAIFIQNLKGHMLKHKEVVTDFKEFNCEHCCYTTKFRGTFNRHLLIHSQNKPHICSLCNKKFVSKLEIEAHIISKHSQDKKLMATITNKIHECQQCSYKCIFGKSFKRHLLKHE